MYFYSRFKHIPRHRALCAASAPTSSEITARVGPGRNTVAKDVDVVLHVLDDDGGRRARRLRQKHHYKDVDAVLHFLSDDTVYRSEVVPRHQIGGQECRKQPRESEALASR
jgi:hypothetical protein